MVSSMIPPLHAPHDRVVVGQVGAWELRHYREGDRRLAYFADKGFAHVQLWHAATGTSILTPSRLTGGEFELWCAPERVLCPAWPGVEAELRDRGIAPPGRHAVRALERWFVLPTESRAGRLLRSWWAGVDEASR